VPRILVIEDDPGVLEVVSNVLSADGWDVLQADGAANAYTALRRADFDLVLSDLFASSLRGPALDLCVLQELAGMTPIVLMTGHPAIRDSHADAWGLTAILHKPCSLDQLRTTVRAALPAWRQRVSGSEP
jgi:DNA-binding NtrC family response regulator